MTFAQKYPQLVDAANAALNEIEQNLKDMAKVTFWLYIQSPNGYKREQVKTFNDRKHFSNWFRMMNKKGYKIIDEQEIK